jgi:hypothetical protein
MDECLAELKAEEIKAGLDHIGDLKAPWLYVMPSVVYKKCWNFMGDQIVKEVLALLKGG